MLVSEENKKILVGLIWSLKSSDFSILQAWFMEPDFQDVQVTASRGGNAIFYKKLQEWGMVSYIPEKIELSVTDKSVPESIVIDTYKLPAEIKPLMKESAHKAMTTGWPPRESSKSPEALQMLNAYAEEGNADSQCKLGILYAQGGGVPQDHKKSMEWYLKAAEKNHTTAMNNIGSMYFEGLGVDKNPMEAAIWFRKSADLGNAAAMENLGMMYQHGIGLARDIKAAIDWFTKAANLGHVGSMVSLGELNVKGIASPQNFFEAHAWFIKAAQKGHPLAQCRLGYLYANGLGVPQDDLQSYVWFTLGISGGLDAHEHRNIVAARLDPAQVAEGNRRAKEWNLG